MPARAFARRSRPATNREKILSFIEHATRGINPMTAAGPHFDISLLTTAYLPPVEYFFTIAHSDRVLIEQHEAYQKQSWRSRCRILAAGGPEDLSIPIIKEERRSRPIRDIRIDYSEPWLQHHIRAFAAAYHSSVFPYVLLRRRPPPHSGTPSRLPFRPEHGTAGETAGTARPRGPCFVDRKIYKVCRRPSTRARAWWSSHGSFW
jgi:WbqC-like protein family.